MKIHLCIVTGQPLANLIPLLQEKPEVVALAITTDMASAANTFITTLKESGWQESRIICFDTVPDHHYEAILERAMDIASELADAYPDGEITLNATGGNKLMTLAFTNACNDKSRYRVIYTDTTHNSLEVLQPSLLAIPIESVLNLTTYLKAEGKTLRSTSSDVDDWRNKAEQRKAATKYLGNHCQALLELVGQFNGAWGGKTNEHSAPLRLRNPPRGRWREAVRLLAEANIIDWGEAENTLTPMNPEATAYLTGGWLEEFVWWVATDAGAQEAHCSVKFTDDYDRKADLRNEIDVAILHNNRLLLVECKTGNVTKDGKDAEIVYKLDSLMDQAAGTLGNGLLVSSQSLAHTTRKGREVNTRSRARSVNIHTAEVDELKSLPKTLKGWLETGKWLNNE